MDSSNAAKAISRRNLLKAGAGLGAGAAVVALPAFGLLGGSDSGHAGQSAQMPPSRDAGSDMPLVAYVRDARQGEVALMYGTTEVVVKDRQLVARLLGVVQG